jgi:prepilin-type processing-associated H-X9-DG protein
MRGRGRVNRSDVIVLFVSAAMVICGLSATGQSGREPAKRAVCQSNLRQLTLAWTCYADDNEGNLINGDTGEYDAHIDETPWVLADWRISMTVAEKELAIRQGALFPYTQDVRLYRCPLGDVAETRTYTVVDSMNGHSWLFQVMFKRFDEIQHPDRRFVFLDDGGTAHIALGGWTCYPDGRERWWDPPGIRHNDGTTLSFADGHV